MFGDIGSGGASTCVGGWVVARFFGIPTTVVVFGCGPKIVGGSVPARFIGDSTLLSSVGVLG